MKAGITIEVKLTCVKENGEISIGTSSVDLPAWMFSDEGGDGFVFAALAEASYKAMEIATTVKPASD